MVKEVENIGSKMIGSVLELVTTSPVKDRTA